VKMMTAVLRGLFLTTLRNRQGLFWTFFSPLMFMVVFSLFGNGGQAPLRLYLAGNPATVHLVRAVLRESHAVTLVRERSVRQAVTAIRSGQLDAAMVFPSTRGGSVGVYVSRTNPLQAAEAEGVLGALVSELNVALSGRPPLFVPRFHAVAGQSLSYLDFLVPGILALMAMNNSLFGLAGLLTRWKETKVLRRFLATPMRPVHFLGAAILNQLVVGLLSLGIVLGVALGIMHAHETIDAGPLLLVLVMGVGTFLAIGFFIGGIAKSQEAVLPIVNIIAFPMMFLSGVFFPVSTLPSALRHVVAVLPLTFLVNALRGMMNSGIHWNAQMTTDVAGLLAWLLAAIVATARTWRWE
jgi:ABC-2 type transport system permease protein